MLLCHDLIIMLLGGEYYKNQNVLTTDLDYSYTESFRLHCIYFIPVQQLLTSTLFDIQFMYCSMNTALF